jgi:hypothetical protein
MDSIQVATIVCPRCRAELDLHLDLCPQCGSALHVHPANSASGDDEPIRVLDRPWVLAVLLLHVGLLGIPLYCKTRYSVATRAIICLLSVVYTILAVAFIYVVGSWLFGTLLGPLS